MSLYTLITDILIPLSNLVLLVWLIRWASHRPRIVGVATVDGGQPCPSQPELDARIDSLRQHVDSMVEERNTRIENLALRLDTAEAAVSEKILNCQTCLEVAVAKGGDAAAAQARILAVAEGRKIKDDIAKLRGDVAAIHARVDTLSTSIDEVARAILAIRDEDLPTPGLK